MDFTAILKTVAPWLASAAGGPLAGMAVTAIADSFGLTDKTTDAIKQAISGATPEQMLALKNADKEFALQMQAMGFKQITDLEALAAGDRKDARQMQTTTKSLVPAILSTVVTVGYFGILTGLLTGHLTMANDSQALLLMLGSLTTGWGVVMAFWFGTTSSSARKTEIIAQAPAVK
jgi:hypothetical protein